jgi:hypothetical protein
MNDWPWIMPYMRTATYGLGTFRDRGKVMNRRLSTWLLFGTLLAWPLTARGQETSSRIARRMIFNAPSFQAEAPTASAHL